MPFFFVPCLLYSRIQKKNCISFQIHTFLFFLPLRRTPPSDKHKQNEKKKLVATLSSNCGFTISFSNPNFGSKQKKCIWKVASCYCFDFVSFTFVRLGSAATAFLVPFLIILSAFFPLYHKWKSLCNFCAANNIKARAPIIIQPKVYSQFAYYVFSQLLAHTMHIGYVWVCCCMQSYNMCQSPESRRNIRPIDTDNKNATKRIRNKRAHGEWKTNQSSMKTE